MKPNFKVLDGLRGIAATYVVINHSRSIFVTPGSTYAKIVPVSQWTILHKIYYSLLQVTTLGREFVILFFILSGFSIAYSLQHKGSVLQFYMRRLIRLYPAYLVAVFWAAMAFYLATRLNPNQYTNLYSVFNSVYTTFSNLFYVSKGAFTGQMWSLTHEVIFYLIIPFCILHRRAYYIVSAGFYIASLPMNLTDVSGNNIVMQYLLDFNIYFAVGVWVFYNYSLVAGVFTVKKTTYYLAYSLFGF